MILQLWTTKRKMGDEDEDESDVQDTSGYEKSRVKLA
jgi:hypothetical protein